MTRQPLHRLIVTPLAYLAACMLAAGLIAYPLRLLLPEHLIKFNTIVSRGAELLLIAGLVPLGRRLGIGKNELGVRVSISLFFNLLLKGFAFGALLLGLHALILVAADVREVLYERLEYMRMIRTAGKSLAVGIAVGAIEEPVFRGFFFGSLAMRTSRFNAVWISSFLFAALHYLDSDLRLSSTEIRWTSGFVVLLDALKHLKNIELNSFLALFSAGAFLACVRLLRPRDSLSLCIGIHAGWVFIIKSVKSFTYRNSESSLAWMVSNLDGFVGYLSTAWISVLIMLLAWVIYRRNLQFAATTR